MNPRTDNFIFLIKDRICRNRSIPLDLNEGKGRTIKNKKSWRTEGIHPFAKMFVVKEFFTLVQESVIFGLLGVKMHLELFLRQFCNKDQFILSEIPNREPKDLFLIDGFETVRDLDGFDKTFGFVEDFEIEVFVVFL
jgi:hypothetical protein